MLVVMPTPAATPLLVKNSSQLLAVVSERCTPDAELPFQYEHKQALSLNPTDSGAVALLIAQAIYVVCRSRRCCQTDLRLHLAGLVRSQSQQQIECAGGDHKYEPGHFCCYCAS